MTKREPRPNPQIVTARSNAILGTLLTLPAIRESEHFTRLVGTYLSDDNGRRTYADALTARCDAYAQLEAALPKDSDLLNRYAEATGSLALAETMAAFDLGRRIEAAIANQTRRPVFDRLFDQLQTQIAAEPEDRGNVRGDMTALRRAIPTAIAILITGDVLHSASVGPIDAYMESERQRATADRPEDENDPGHECLIAATNEQSVYYIALALGLLLSEVV